MATAKWDTPSAAGSNILSTVADSLANAGASAFITYDNSSNKDYHANIRVTLGSLNPTTGATITLVIFATQNGSAPDNTASVGGGDRYTQAVTTGSGVKEVNFPMVRLYPESLRFSLVNSTNVTLASSGNALYVRPFNENVT